MSVARQGMVEGQLRPNKVTDARIVAAMSEIPRENFVPKGLATVAYADEDLEVAPGRWLMEPMVLARLAMAAEIKSTDIILEIGPATGYSTAVLAKLSTTVVAVDQEQMLADQATETLSGLGIDNVAVVTGGLCDGVPDQGPFDVIFINGAVETIPECLTDQLVDGGRLVCVLMEGGVGRAHLVTRFNDVLGHRTLFDANVAPLPGFEVPKQFTF